MDAHDKLMVQGDTASDADLAGLQRVYEVFARAGLLAGIEELLALSHDDLEMRTYAAKAVASPGESESESELLRGHDEIRDFFRESAESGIALSIRTRGFEVNADTVVVRGSIRVGRPDGSFAEANVSWHYRFRDGLVDRVSWEPRAGG